MEQVDPILLSNTREWLRRTKEDLDAAALLLTIPSPLVRTALFHSQQAVEKAMKAFLTWNDAAFREVHNLEELGESCIRLDSTLASAVTLRHSADQIRCALSVSGCPLRAQRRGGTGINRLGPRICGHRPGATARGSPGRKLVSASRAWANPTRGYTSGPVGHSVGSTI